MEKGQIPIFAELTLADYRDYTTKTTSIFTGTDNPRHLRVIFAALARPRKRDEIDHIAGASNGPELVAELRRRGLDFPCDRVPAIDRDGYPTRCGVYHLTDTDRRKLTAWQRLRDTRGKA